MSVCPHCTNGVVELLISRRACEYCAGGEGVTAPTVNRATRDPGRTRDTPPHLLQAAAGIDVLPEGHHECTLLAEDGPLADYVHVDVGPEWRTVTLQLVEEGTAQAPSALRVNARFYKEGDAWVLGEDVNFPVLRGGLLRVRPP